MNDLNDQQLDALLASHFRDELDWQRGRAETAFRRRLADPAAATDGGGFGAASSRLSPPRDTSRRWLFGLAGTALAASVAWTYVGAQWMSPENQPSVVVPGAHVSGASSFNVGESAAANPQFGDNNIHWVDSGPSDNVLPQPAPTWVPTFQRPSTELPPTIYQDSPVRPSGPEPAPWPRWNSAAPSASQ